MRSVRSLGVLIVLVLACGLAGCAGGKGTSAVGGQPALLAAGPDSGARADDGGPVLLALGPGEAAATSVFEEPYVPDEDESAARVAAPAVPDPLEGFNRAMYQFNDKLYFYLLKPVAQGWKAVIPEFLRVGLNNAFYNVRFPIRFVNNVLQGNPIRAGQELSRFLLNSTFGLLGLFEPSSRFEWMNPKPTDAGLTLATWTEDGHGAYLVLPVFGPTSVRDGLGTVGDRFLDPINYLEPLWVPIAIQSGDRVNKTSFRIGDYEALKAAAVDPYLAIRDAYIQNRAAALQEVRETRLEDMGH